MISEMEKKKRMKNFKMMLFVLNCTENELIDLRNQAETVSGLKLFDCKI